MDSDLIVWFIMLGVAFAIFLAVRQFWLWYFGVSRIVELLESIDHSLHHMPVAVGAAVNRRPTKAA